MKKNYVRFVDTVDFKPPEISKEVRDLYANTSQLPGQALRIRIAATHAGRITRNNGFYLPHKMKEGASTFIAQYPKPIQVHHDDHSDPVGRVVASNYVDLSGGLRDSLKPKLQDSVKLIDNTLLDAFIGGKLPLKEILDFANKYFIQDDSLLDNPDYEGLGYIELVADITDPSAIQKVLDGRYLTGSVGASTDSAVCSVCLQDWTGEDGRCDHSPGKDYEGKRCVLIAGNLVYDEWSFVNRPADTKSRVIELNTNGVQDFVTVGEETVHPIISLVVDSSKFKEDSKMAVVDSENKVTDQEDPFKDLKDFLGDSYTEVVGEDAEGIDYARMLLAYVDQATDKEAAKKEMLDAKLTAAGRKALPKSTFCKPPDGYPVNDCGHAKSAMAYAKKNNEASSVVACIRRKAARLGCPFKDEIETAPVADAVGQYIVDYFDSYSDEELIQLKNGVLAALKERGLNCNCGDLESKKEAIELTAKLVAAEDEVKKLHADFDSLQAAQSKLVADLYCARALHIVDLKNLSGEKVTLETISNELKEKDSNDLQVLLQDLSKKVDIAKIIDNLNSGLANIPTESVTDPTVVIDNSIKVANPNIEAEAKLQWLKIRTNYGQELADKFIEDCKNQGLLPATWSEKK